MIKRGICCIFAWLMLISFGIPASAAEGSIQVQTDAASVALYQVGTAEGIGYRLKESCGGGYLTVDDTLSAELAAWLSGRVRQEEKLAPQKGSKVYSGLKEGLYLVCCQENGGFEPFLVTIPWDGYYWEVEVNPASAPLPQTGDTVGSTIFALAASAAGLTVLGRRRKKY